MKYLKRFTDFCGGFAAFSAIIYFIGQFLGYKPESTDGMLEKLKSFISRENTKNFKAYIIMIGLLVISVVVSRIFERLPFVGLSVSFMPLLWTVFMLASNWLYERPMLYVALAILHTVGNIIYAVSLDREDGKRRGFLCVNVAGGIFGVLCLFVWRRSQKLAAITMTDEEFEKLSDIDTEIFEGIEGESASLLLIIGIALLVTVLVSVILRDLYYIDVILCAIPFVYSVKVFFFEELTVFGGMVFAATAMYFIFRVMILLSEPMRADKKRKIIGQT